MSLSGMVFCVSGTMSLPRKVFERDVLEANGGGVKKGVTREVTHLIVADTTSTSSKAAKARKNGTQIVDEGWVLARVKQNSPEDPKSAGVTKKRKAAAPAAAAAALSAELLEGASVKVKGSGSNWYVLKNHGTGFSCSCPAWRNQSRPIDLRTCKHLKAYRGAEREAARVGSVAAAPAKKKQKRCSAAAVGLMRGDDAMLAKTFAWNCGVVTKNFLVSEKLDGMRAIWNGEALVSRAGNPIHAPAFFTAGLPSEVALDGELFMGRGSFSETISVARSGSAGERWRGLVYVVFDAPTAPGGFEERLATAEAAVHGATFARIHPHAECEGEEELKAELAKVEALGGEGLMLRRKGSAYAKSVRSGDLLKVKSFKDDEAIVTGHQVGKGRHKGRCGALECRSRSGKSFKVGTGLTDAERAAPPALGSVITFRYFEISKAGVPRFPSFQRIRPDVDASEFAESS